MIETAEIEHFLRKETNGANCHLFADCLYHLRVFQGIERRMPDDECAPIWANDLMEHARAATLTKDFNTLRVYLVNQGWMKVNISRATGGNGKDFSHLIK